MNPYVTDELKKKWSQYEFIGKPIVKANGKKYCKATYKFWPWQGHTHIYDYDKDFFWHGVSIAELP